MFESHVLNRLANVLWEWFHSLKREGERRKKLSCPWTRTPMVLLDGARY